VRTIAEMKARVRKPESFFGFDADVVLGGPR
jgi:hypothetical protein